jgi:hypothetical protein
MSYLGKYITKEFVRKSTVAAEILSARVDVDGVRIVHISGKVMIRVKD